MRVGRESVVAVAEGAEGGPEAVLVIRWHTTTRGKTPYELVKGQQPMIKHLVPFGCIGYMHAEKSKVGNKIPDHHRAEEVLMLGYRSPFSNIWKVQVQDDQKRVLHSIHVDWNFESHGLSNALSVMSKDHLDVLGQQWGIDLTIDQGLKAIEAPESQHQLCCQDELPHAEPPTTPQTDLHDALEAPLPDYYGNNPLCIIEPLPNIEGVTNDSPPDCGTSSGAAPLHSPTYLELHSSNRSHLKLEFPSSTSPSSSRLSEIGTSAVANSLFRSFKVKIATVRNKEAYQVIRVTCQVVSLTFAVGGLGVMVKGKKWARAELTPGPVPEWCCGVGLHSTQAPGIRSPHSPSRPPHQSRRAP